MQERPTPLPIGTKIKLGNIPGSSLSTRGLIGEVTSHKTYHRDTNQHVYVFKVLHNPNGYHGNSFTTVYHEEYDTILESNTAASALLEKEE